MLQSLWKYIIGPIVADAQGLETITWKGTTAAAGYNPINTLVYAITAVTIIYFIYRFIQNREIQFNTNTAINTIPFILLGGTLRFLDDAQIIPYPYSIALITPLIYFLIAAIYIPVLYKFEDQKILQIGLIILLPVITYTLTTFNTLNILYAFTVLTTALLLTVTYYYILEEQYNVTYLIILAFTQFFEGTASMISTFYNYQPKQLLAQLFNNLFGAPGILMLKTLILALAITVITDIKDQKLKTLVLITLYAIGLGTGFRVFLRATAGL